MAAFTDVKKLDAHMLGASYIDGFAPSMKDVSVFNAIAKPAAAYPNALRWYCHIASFSPAKIASLPGTLETLAAAPAAAAPAAKAPAPAPAPAAEAGPSKKEAKAAAKADKKAEKKEKPKEEKKEEKPKEDEAAKAAKEAAKKKEKIYKEGGKKGVEIEGASELGGLDFFCTTLELPDGDVAMLEYSMTAMNAEPDPTAEERKGCSGAVGKMIFSAGIQQLAMVGYVPDLAFNKSSDKVDVTEWMESVCKAVAGSITVAAAAVTSVMPDGKPGKITGKRISAVVKSDPEKGKFALKDKDSAMAAAFAFLRSKDAFPEDKDDDSDEMIFGDDDCLDDYE